MTQLVTSIGQGEIKYVIPSSLSPPLCWNAFPFHPHLPRRYQTNRAPNTAEVNLGSEYLQQLAKIFAPIHIAGVGNKGFAAAQQAFPETNITKLRHPSFGGKSAFISGMDELCE